MVSALLYRQPCHSLLPVFAEEVVSALPGIDDADRTLSIATCLVHYFDFMDAHDRAEAVRALTEPIARSPQVRPLSAFSWWTRIGEHLMFMGEHERSQHAHRMALQVVESNGLSDQECYALGSLCQTYTDWGKYGEAERLIARAQTMLVPKYPVDSIFMQWLRYYWAGAAGTGFYVDPKEDLICVWMTPAQPGMARRYNRYLFKQLVYQAIVDQPQP